MRVNWLLAMAWVALVACATGSTTPPTVDVTGTWAGDWVGSAAIGNGGITMTLQQTGAAVAGDVVMSGGSPFSGPVTGTVSGDVFSINYRGGNADLTVKGNEMSGFTRFSRWTLKRQ